MCDWMIASDNRQRAAGKGRAGRFRGGGTRRRSVSPGLCVAVRWARGAAAALPVSPPFMASCVGAAFSSGPPSWLRCGFAPPTPRSRVASRNRSQSLATAPPSYFHTLPLTLARRCGRSTARRHSTGGEAPEPPVHCLAATFHAARLTPPRNFTLCFFAVGSDNTYDANLCLPKAGRHMVYLHRQARQKRMLDFLLPATYIAHFLRGIRPVLARFWI